MPPQFHEKITRAEQKFEDIRKTTGMVAGPMLFVGILLFPFPGLSPEAHRLAAVMGLVIILWITEALPLAVTGIMGPTLAVLLGVAPAAKAFASFADPIMFLFIGAFILARAISLHELDRRFAYYVLTLRWVGQRPGRILFAYGAVCCCISMWISNTATVAMMFPIGLAIIKTLNDSSGVTLNPKYGTAMMLICAFGASIGGLATPVGTPTNLIGLGYINTQLDRQVTFFEWMSFAMPVVLILYLFLFFYLYVLCPAGVKTLPGIHAVLVRERGAMTNPRKAQRNTLVAFGLTVALWMMPGLLALIHGERHALTVGFSRHVPESVAALIGACLLFLMPVDRGKSVYTLDLKSALEIDWGVLAFYGGGIALGQMVFETKLAEAAGLGLAGVLAIEGNLSVLTLASVATLTSEFTSNVASANMIVPVVILMTGSGGFRAAIAATMAASLGFMLPISTPTNAIVYSSGFVPIARMIKYGLLLDLIGVAVIYLCSLLFVPAR